MEISYSLAREKSIVEYPHLRGVRLIQSHVASACVCLQTKAFQVLRHAFLFIVNLFKGTVEVNILTYNAAHAMCIEHLPVANYDRT